MSIFVCGDIHSTLDINKLDQFIERDDLTEKDYLIICGDTGICGFSKEQETALNEDENKPMYNRFRQVWCPGSTFKPIIAAIGLESEAIDPMEDYGNEGLSWQKDWVMKVQ